jgi:hypothetical protein
VLKAADWQQGATIRVLFEHEKGAAPRLQSEGTLAEGQRTFVVTAPPGVELAPGRYVVRVELVTPGSTTPLQSTTDAYVPEPEWLVSAGGLSTRRGPSTGLQYVPTADARFRRTERLRLEVPRSARGGQATARLLARDGKPLSLAITLSERLDESGMRLIVAEVPLAALAQGDYAVEITVDEGGRKESSTYAFRVVP